MPKYLKQRNNFSCGPIAYLNALIWHVKKAKFTYKNDYKTAVSLLECDREGTSTEDMGRVLKATFKHCERLPKLDLDRVKEHFLSGGAMVLGHAEVDAFWNTTGDGHYSFWFLDFDNYEDFNEPRLFSANFLTNPKERVLETHSIEDLKVLQEKTEKALKEDLEIWLIK